MTPVRPCYACIRTLEREVFGKSNPDYDGATHRCGIDADLVLIATLTSPRYGQALRP